MSRLYVVRHGETEFNKQNRYAGTIDIGKKQARNFAKVIEKLPIDIIISSSKKRALETAEIIREYIKKPIIKFDEFIERNIGVYEGLTREEAESKYPDLWDRNVLYTLDNTEHGGESLNQVINRTSKALNDILIKYINQNILLVTHGYVSRIIYELLNSCSYDETKEYLLDNCEMVEYNI